MQAILSDLEMLYAINHIPMTLLDREGNFLTSFPKEMPKGVHPFAYKMVIEDFRLQKRDITHPLISFLGSGFLLGVMQLTPERYLLIGLVSSLSQSRKDILSMVTEVISPHSL